ncbi:MAG TPA: metallophosphoesterase [Spirochaetota bacterium]|nr:metallophosphoesterase [Spirochaetota bacterium]
MKKIEILFIMAFVMLLVQTPGCRKKIIDGSLNQTNTVSSSSTSANSDSSSASNTDSSSLSSSTSSSLPAYTMPPLYSGTLPAGAWQFVVTGDGRGGNGEYDDAGEEVDSQTVAINAPIREAILNMDPPPLCLVFTGDMINQANLTYLQSWKTRFFDPIKNAGIEVLPVHGNHEGWGGGDFKAVFGSELPDNGPDGYEDLVYRVDVSNASFLILDEYDDDGTISSDILNWLTVQFNDPSLKRHRFLSGHAPLWKCANHTPLYGAGDSATRDMVINQFVEGGVSAYFCGHDHRYKAAKKPSGSNDFHMFLVGTAGAPLNNATDNLSDEIILDDYKGYGYTVFTVDGDNITVDFIEMDHTGYLDTRAVSVNFSAIEPVVGSSTNSYTELISEGETWKYLDDGSDQGTAWKEEAFDDSGWSSGNGIFGFGTIDGETITTTLNDLDQVTFYFRKTFTVTNVSNVSSVKIEILAEDGGVIWINGTEAARDNITSGTIDYQTLASGNQTPENARSLYYVASPDTILNEGTNTIAVEVHNVATSSSDIGFELSLAVQYN